MSTAGRGWVQAALLGLLLASAGVPALDTAAGWDATSYAGWPGVGLSALIFLGAGEDRRRWMMVAQTAGLGLVLSATYDVRWWQGAAASLAVTLPALLCVHWLRPTTAAYRRFNAGEVDAYHGVTAAVGLLCGVLSAGAAAVAGRGDASQLLLTGLISFFAATTAQVIVLPFHLRERGGWSIRARSVEMWGQRLTVLVALLVVFVPQPMLPVTFVLFPILGWVAIRGSAAETHQQVLVVSVVAFAATLAGHGPLALDSLNNHAEFAPLLVYMFIASVCCLIVPLALTVERLRGATRQAVRSASTVQRMLDSASGTVFIATDPAGLVTHCNQGAEHALGTPVAELLGRPTHTMHTEAEVRRQAQALGVLAPGDSAREAYNAAVVAQISRGVRRDWEFVRGDGERRVVSLNIGRLTGPDGTMIGFLASGEDVTERARAQAALEQAYERERGAVAALREADDMKRRLVSVLSHELRTPITNIAGFSELLREGSLGDLGAEQTTAVERIERNSARLRQLVEDLLTLSQAEASARIGYDDVDLNEVVRQAHDMVSFQSRGRRLDTTIVLASTPVVVRGDQGLLTEAVVKLWSNAIKFTPDGGTITISTTAPVHGTAHDPASRTSSPDRGRVVVADTGMGIAEHEQSRVFSRFYRTSEAAQHAIQGSGLGLSVVETIIAQHDGDIDLHSVPGEGTVIAISIPVDETPPGRTRDPRHTTLLPR